LVRIAIDVAAAFLANARRGAADDGTIVRTGDDAAAVDAGDAAALGRLAIGSAPALAATTVDAPLAKRAAVAAGATVLFIALRSVLTQRRPHRVLRFEQ
jgi:hypothetical protein